MKKTIRNILLLIAVVVTGKIYGQQDPQYTRYMYNMNILNPAYAGSSEALNFSFLGRMQWVGIEGSPKTFTVAADLPLKKRVGVGLSIIADKIGPTNEQNIYFDFSYTLPVTEESKLAFGLKAGATFIQLNKNKLVFNEAEYLTNNPNSVAPNFGLGFFYYTKDYYIGLSMPNILKTEHLYRNSFIRETVHTFLTAGYVYDISDNLSLKPSMILKATAGAPLSLDLSLNALIKRFLELGLSWRYKDSVSFLINTKVTDNIRIGYAYDYTLSELSNYNSGSHELILLITIPRDKNLVSPRFFGTF